MKLFTQKFFALSFAVVLLNACEKTEPEINILLDTNTVETLEPVETLTADFVPPVGGTTEEGIEGPWARRLMGAYSEDGLTWTKTNTVITDQADVADLAVDENGRVYLYYYGWTVGDEKNLPAMAISDDNGKTWIFKNMNFEGFPNRGDVSDPNVVYDNGVFQLYGSTRDNGKTYILHGESIDGINFTYKSVAFKPEDGSAGVAAAYKTEEGWTLLSLASLGFNDGAEAGKIWYTTSQDGETFDLQDSLLFNDGKNAYFHGNVTPLEDGYRLYLFSDMSEGIRSYLSEDGVDWELEKGFRLSIDEDNGLESGFLGDPDVVQLSDGTYFMVYSTLIP